VVTLKIVDFARRTCLRAALAAGLAGLGLTGCAVRDVAPTFNYTLLDGSPRTSADLRGQVVLVNFWATSCAVCVKDMPHLIATHEKFKPRGLQTLAVAMSYDAPASVAHFAETRRLPFGVVIDNTGAIAKAFGDVAATPTTVLIDKQGRIAKRWVGAPDVAKLHALVEQLLAET